MVGLLLVPPRFTDCSWSAACEHALTDPARCMAPVALLDRFKMYLWFIRATYFDDWRWDCRKTLKSSISCPHKGYKYLILQKVQISKTPHLDFFDSLVRNLRFGASPAVLSLTDILSLLELNIPIKPNHPWGGDGKPWVCWGKQHARWSMIFYAKGVKYYAFSGA